MQLSGMLDKQWSESETCFKGTAGCGWDAIFEQVVITGNSFVDTLCGECFSILVAEFLTGLKYSLG